MTFSRIIPSSKKTAVLLVAVLLASLLFFGAVPQSSAQTASPMYRLYNPLTGDHFYSADPDEKNNAMNFYSYRVENTEMHLYRHQATSTVPLYRMYNHQIQNHFYTTSDEERNTAVNRYRYIYEGVAGYIYRHQATSTQPLYRLWNEKMGDHFYTTSPTERDEAQNRHRYTFEGIAGYVPGPLQQQQRTVLHYYYNTERDRQLSGGQTSQTLNAVIPLKRTIPHTITPIQDTVRLLLQTRLTEQERATGYTSEFPGNGFTLVGANLANGVLTLEFADPNNFTQGGSTRVRLLWSQIEKTAKQFPEVSTVKFIPEQLFQP